MADNLSIASAITLKTLSEDNEPLTACFLPGKGMNLISYKKGAIEIIDQSTQALFEERFAGLGAMIGPHFHHRNPEIIPLVKHEELFPHIARVHATGVKEPFSHGIGRYAPWSVESVSEQTIKAFLNGEDTWNGVKLKELEGQNFKMGYEATLIAIGLEIKLYVTSDTESVVGLHTYYSLGEKSEGKITCRVQDHYVDKSVVKPIPSTWNYSRDRKLIYPLDQETDFGFHPFPNPLESAILLECESHNVQISYQSNNQENSFQIWHPLHASFVCIEPLSAKDPRKPKLSVSQLKILISIL